MGKRSPLELDHHAVAEVLRDVGSELLLPAFRQENYGRIHHKEDGSVVTAIDITSQRTIHARLAKIAPAFAFLSEEMTSEQQQEQINHNRPCWCLDPLDGTSNFIAGLPCFAISLGLIADGRAIAGWIYDPVADELFAAPPDDPQLYCNGEPLEPGIMPPPPLEEAVGFVDFKRLPHATAVALIADPPCHSLRNLGSCALEWAWLAGGRARFIVHGGESVWDYAAGLALAARSNCVVTDFAGDSPLQRGKLGASIIAASDQATHQALRSALASSQP